MGSKVLNFIVSNKLVLHNKRSEPHIKTNHSYNSYFIISLLIQFYYFTLTTLRLESQSFTAIFLDISFTSYDLESQNNLKFKFNNLVAYLAKYFKTEKCIVI